MQRLHGGWVATEERLPDDDVVVETKIDDNDGLRNVQQLKRQGRLWFFPDGSMYVYYTPTHWRPVELLRDYQHGKRRVV